jgi:hypothetical protein
MGVKIPLVLRANTAFVNSTSLPHPDTLQGSHTPLHFGAETFTMKLLGSPARHQGMGESGWGNFSFGGG